VSLSANMTIQLHTHTLDFTV